MNKAWMLLLLLSATPTVAEEPPLPGGLAPLTLPAETPVLNNSSSKDSSLKSSPLKNSSIRNAANFEEPPLPSIFEQQSTITAKNEPEASPASLHGFAETRAGSRLHNDPRQRNTSIAEARLQLSLDYAIEQLVANITVDVLLDDVDERDSLSLNRGQGEIDLREAWLQKRLTNHIDMKVGRQILTWGTGDLIFINDLFPKDRNSFFIGRDTEYLKAPSDAIKISAFFNWLNMDLVWTPEFDSDRFIDGKRISFFNPITGELSGRDQPVEPKATNKDELALRLYKTYKGVEYALYGYRGYWKSPNGFDPLLGLAIFPRLNVTGASVRGNIARGIGNIEIGYYASKDDTQGKNPFINNSEWRFLAGYERELAPNLTGSFQYYLERIADYDNYKEALLPGQPQRDETRQLLTARLTWLTMNQNLTWSLFSYYSPTDKDFYVRPKLSWKANDQWLIEGGLNLFGGRKQETFFGQFEDTNNAYFAIRYSF